MPFASSSVRPSRSPTPRSAESRSNRLDHPPNRPTSSGKVPHNVHLGIRSRPFRAVVVGALASILVWLGPFAPPRAVGDVLWNNGIVPNGVYSRALSPPAFPLIRVVDDFVIEGPEGWTICSVRVSVVELSGWSSGSELTLYFRADDGGPGDLVREVVAGFDRVATGNEYFGMASYEYLVEDLEIDLCPGTY